MKHLITPLFVAPLLFTSCVNEPTIGMNRPTGVRNLNLAPDSVTGKTIAFTGKDEDGFDFCRQYAFDQSKPRIINDDDYTITYRKGYKGNTAQISINAWEYFAFYSLTFTSPTKGTAYYHDGGEGEENMGQCTFRIK